MRPHSRNIGAIIGINARLLMSCVCGIGAWAVWPTTPEWWGLGVMSVMLGLGAVGGVADALRAMSDLYQRDKAIADMMAQGGPPKSARLVTREDLKRAGMIP
ncbi:MAG: hypothetical protein J0H53_25010 [Rhizobiales bacterium]|nr:hypothetical protein [Hyphomicrobiales bacterium]